MRRFVLFVFTFKASFSTVWSFCFILVNLEGWLRADKGALGLKRQMQVM